jgi:hypothetical protein
MFIVFHIDVYFSVRGEGFLKISKSMTKLLEKNKQFEWTPACETSF